MEDNHVNQTKTSNPGAKRVSEYSKTVTTPAVGTDGKPEAGGSGKVNYLIKNIGCFNEQITIVHEFTEPGSFSYSTTSGDCSKTIPPLSNAHRQALDRGITLAAELLTNNAKFPGAGGPTTGFVQNKK